MEDSNLLYTHEDHPHTLDTVEASRLLGSIIEDIGVSDPSINRSE